LEICNGIDDDCDSKIDAEDEDIVGAINWYPDSDGDLYGDPTLFYAACEQPAGFVADNTDCNDGNAAIYPGALEVCNGIDDDCDGLVDDADRISLIKQAGMPMPTQTALAMPQRQPSPAPSLLAL
jgi:hypothetical protein